MGLPGILNFSKLTFKKCGFGSDLKKNANINNFIWPYLIASNGSVNLHIYLLQIVNTGFIFINEEKIIQKQMILKK